MHEKLDGYKITWNHGEAYNEGNAPDSAAYDEETALARAKELLQQFGIFHGIKIMDDDVRYVRTNQGIFDNTTGEILLEDT